VKHIRERQLPLGFTHKICIALQKSKKIETVNMQTHESSVDLPVSIEEAFAYHERPGALQRLIPPWESVRVESSDGSLTPGSKVTLVTRVAGIPLRWKAEHRDYDPPHRFEDVALSGPFSHWHHRHLFEATSLTTSRLTDHIEYEVPLGGLGQAFGGSFVRGKLESMFAYRHRITKDDLTMASRYNLPPQTIALTGSTGLVGNALVPFLSILGHQPIRTVRHGSDADTTFELPEQNQWSQCDAVVHLAGKSIADARWSNTVKRQIRDSRVGPTRRLCETLASLPSPPKVFVCASAIGIYGNRGDEVLTETSTRGDDFLAEIGEQWEAACRPARDAGIRVVNMRFGLILSPRGGALAKTLLPAKLGLSGPLGSGNQYWSWIAIDDVLGAIYHAIANDQVAGPVNVVAPDPSTNRDFARTLGKVLHRPAFVPAPAPILRVALGEMADALLLTSTRVKPDVLLSTGYQFRFTDLAETLTSMLGSPHASSPEEGT
jgi:uncharacterized protein (TIGR01777 family)